MPARMVPEGSVVTVGSFDGVHLGHQAVLREIAHRARALSRRSVLVTFDPHPLEVVNPAAAPQLLTPAAERLEALAETGLDIAVVLRFDAHLARLEPEQFVNDILLARYQMRELVIGADHGFGRGRAGDVALLRRLGASRGFDVDVVAPVPVPGELGGGGGGHVSSTQIRRAVLGGDLDRANQMLGRPYRISGQVGQGAGRGRALGVPTLNLADVSPRKLLPPDGVYAVRVEGRWGRSGGMMNQGSRPTFGETKRTIEAHLFDFEGNVYGEWVRIEWVRALRPTRQFASTEELRRQLTDDREQAIAALAMPTPVFHA